MSHAGASAATASRNRADRAVLIEVLVFITAYSLLAVALLRAATGFDAGLHMTRDPSRLVSVRQRGGLNRFQVERDFWPSISTGFDAVVAVERGSILPITEKVRARTRPTGLPGWVWRGLADRGVVGLFPLLNDDSRRGRMPQWRPTKCPHWMVALRGSATEVAALRTGAGRCYAARRERRDRLRSRLHRHDPGRRRREEHPPD